MQEMIELINKSFETKKEPDNFNDVPQQIINDIRIDVSIQHLEQFKLVCELFLEKEKQMVIDAYDTNITESLRSDRINIISGEQYYKDNFKL